MTGVGAVLNVARVEPGSRVVVLGAGAVGLCVVQAARVAGAAEVVAVDANPERLAAATRFGATQTVRVDTGGVEAAAASVGGADFAFEATGVEALWAAPLLFLRSGGTAVQLTGANGRLSVDGGAFQWDKNYVVSLYGRCDPQRDFSRLQRLYERRALLVDELVTSVRPLTELRAAIDDLLAGRTLKTVLVP